MTDRERLSDALQFLDDALLREADQAREKGKKRKRNFYGMAALCCCVLLAMLCGTVLWRSQRDVREPMEPSASTEYAKEHFQTTEEPEESLPVLALGEVQLDSMGVFGVDAHDSSELALSMPWDETGAVSALPVFENPWRPFFSPETELSGETKKEMEDFLLELAGRLGMKEEELSLSWPANGFLEGKAETVTILVDYNMSARLTFVTPQPLPEGCSFNPGSSREEMEEAALYLTEQYKTLLGMEEPQAAVIGGGYDFDGKRSAYRVEIYEGAGTLEQQMVNCYFNQAVFYANQEGTVAVIRLNRSESGESVGAYPLITEPQAREELLQGFYVTAGEPVPEDTEEISRGELVYLLPPMCNYYMPYYRFYVELSQGEKENGIKTYGICYVPAVERAYLEDEAVNAGQ